MLKERIVQCAVNLYRRGLVAGLGGNISARLPKMNEIWITPSGLYKPDLKPEDLVKVDLEGKVLEGVFKPSIEWPLHVAIYKKRVDVNAVVHAHNPVTMGLALAGIKPKPITPEAVTLLGDVPILKFMYPSTAELGKLVGKEIAGRHALILQNHGVVAVGHDLTEVACIVEVLEEVSTTMLIANLVGKPKLLSPRQIELIKKLLRGYKIVVKK